MGLVHIFQGPARTEENRTDGLLTESGGRGVHEAEVCQGHGGEDGVEHGSRAVQKPRPRDRRSE